jgi:hypothetical protein
MNMFFSPPGFSCGVHQLGYIEECLGYRECWENSKPKKVRLDLKKGIVEILTKVAKQEVCDNDEYIQDYSDCAFILFSDNMGNKAGIYLAAYIKRHQLGTITVSEKRKNPNSGHLIQVWIWGVDWKALNKHLKDDLKVTVEEMVVDDDY